MRELLEYVPRARGCHGDVVLVTKDGRRDVGDELHHSVAPGDQDVSDVGQLFHERLEVCRALRVLDHVRVLSADGHPEVSGQGITAVRDRHGLRLRTLAEKDPIHMVGSYGVQVAGARREGPTVV
eukprot:scaffold1102_cov256-Pinguiococcus_pyrenoidosus.AAC.8